MEAAEEQQQWQASQQQKNLRFRIGLGKEMFKRQSSGGGIVDLGFRERRKIGNFLFLAFCGVCLMLGVVKIFAGGWLGLAGVLEKGDFEVSNFLKCDLFSVLLKIELLVL